MARCYPSSGLSRSQSLPALILVRSRPSRFISQAPRPPNYTDPFPRRHQHFMPHLSALPSCSITKQKMRRKIEKKSPCRRVSQGGRHKSLLFDLRKTCSFFAVTAGPVRAWLVVCSPWPKGASWPLACLVADTAAPSPDRASQPFASESFCPPPSYGNATLGKACMQIYAKLDALWRVCLLFILFFISSSLHALLNRACGSCTAQSASCTPVL